jgi:hypothetical protein
VNNLETPARDHGGHQGAKTIWGGEARRANKTGKCLRREAHTHLGSGNQEPAAESEKSAGEGRFTQAEQDVEGGDWSLGT